MINFDDNREFMYKFKKKDVSIALGPNYPADDLNKEKTLGFRIKNPFTPQTVHPSSEVGIEVWKRAAKCAQSGCWVM